MEFIGVLGVEKDSTLLSHGHEYGHAQMQAYEVTPLWNCTKVHIKFVTSYSNMSKEILPPINELYYSSFFFLLKVERGRLQSSSLRPNYCSMEALTMGYIGISSDPSDVAPGLHSRRTSL